MTTYLPGAIVRLWNNDSEYVGSHAAEHRPPPGTVCEECGKAHDDSDDKWGRIVLAQCSMCETWFCTEHYTMHTYTAPVVAAKASWWKRVTGRG